jgi:hypothetical protein
MELTMPAPALAFVDRIGDPLTQLDPPIVHAGTE